MTNPSRITIREIAQQAGVSTQTVSRVINKRPDVAKETRKRVQAVIDATGFFPNKYAQGLTRGRTNTIGMVISGLPHYGPSQSLSGVDRQVQKMGYDLSISLIHSEEDVPAAVRQMRAQNVAGVIWSVSGSAERRIASLYDDLVRHGIPVVVLTVERDPRLTNVEIDNRHGACIATEHLLSQGYKTVGTITGRLEELVAQRRLAGWETVVGHADPSMIVEGDWTAASGYEALMLLVENRPDVDAVFVANDQMALGAMRAAKALGKCVPEDLGIIGYDDIPEARFFTPSLSTVRQDLVESTASAVKRLVTQIEAMDNDTSVPAETIVLLPKLVIRESSRGRTPNEALAPNQHMEEVVAAD